MRLGNTSTSLTLAAVSSCLVSMTATVVVVVGEEFFEQTEAREKQLPRDAPTW